MIETGMLYAYVISTDEVFDAIPGITRIDPQKL